MIVVTFCKFLPSTMKKYRKNTKLIFEDILITVIKIHEKNTNKGNRELEQKAKTLKTKIKNCLKVHT